MMYNPDNDQDLDFAISETSLEGDDTLIEVLESEESADWEFELSDKRLAEIERGSHSSANQTAFSAFQKRMGKYSQLPSNEQAYLVKQYQAALKIRENTSGKKLKKSEQGVIDAGERAMELLAGSGFRLMLLIVRELAEARHGKEKASELLPDLMSEANEALLEAASQYDASRGLSFSTYLARVVRDKVRMSLTKEGPLKLSSSWTRIKRIATVRTAILTEELGRTPTIKEIQNDLLDRCLEWAETKLTESQKALPKKQRKELMLAKLRKQGMLGAIRDLEEVLAATQAIASLDIEISEEGGGTLGDFIGNPDSGAIFDNIELTELREALNRALSTLADREREIILYRFGFIDGEMWTYSKIADKFKVTSERIRQIERSVLAKFNSPHGQYSYLSGFLPSQFE
jgi:RNA polymerase primary sigma factor